ncbi:MAG: ParB/RepB/Spo0J family partition protein [Sedimentisphaerales bacterium]|nr:ParB/RepB/Spo0J family partition protein [Sedimentisphaerales bacterium]
MIEAKKEKPRHLGRGLESLLGPITVISNDKNELITDRQIHPNLPSDKELGTSFREIDIDKIKVNPYQARTVFNEMELNDLANSIKTNGVIQPIIVRPVGQGYEIIAGERRFRASQIASLRTIPAIVRKANDEQMHEWSLIENIQRVDLNPIERAKAYREYLNAFSLTQAQAAERLGEDRSVVANYLRLLDLPQEIKQLLADGKLSMGHARAILALPTDDLRRKLANRAMAGRLSVREVEKLVRRYLTSTGQEKNNIRLKPTNIIDLEKKLASQLATKVNIETRKNGQKGKIIIEFYSLDEFDGILERLGLTNGEEI